MKLWHIVNGDDEIGIEVGNSTILKGNNSRWYELTRLIDDYFNNKKSEVKIYEDTQLLNVKDWECLFVPFDAHIQLDKVNSKSPLFHLLNEVSDEIAMSPIYHEFLDLWENLKEEVNIIQQKILKYELELDLKSFEITDLQTYLYFTSMTQLMTPIRYKMLLLKLFSERKLDKKRLIVIELPELYALEKEFLKFTSLIEKLTNKGIYFLICTQRYVNGNNNYHISNQIINEARIEDIKRKIIKELPFYLEEEKFNLVKKEFLRLVDNMVTRTEEIELSTEMDEEFRTVFYVIAKHLKIQVKVDLSGVSGNINAFLKAFIA